MKRVKTGVPGLDLILNGGLLEGGVYILEGPPGVGKTTLANQLAYVRAREGTKTLYVTMLAESHARMLQHMAGQTFFDHRVVNADVFYLSGYRELEREGLRGVVKLLQGELSRTGAGIVVVDGLVVESSDDQAVRQFVHELQSLVTALACTCLLLTSGRGTALSAEQTMVDGILVFEEFIHQWRAERRMHVRKFRGSYAVQGKHTYCITDEGIVFFPRFEGMPFEGSPLARDARHRPTGIGALDGALPQGGVLEGSSSVLLGNSGSGKTSLCLAFAARATREAPCLYVACTESPGELQQHATALLLDIGGALGDGRLVVESIGRQDESLDEMAYKLLRLIDEHRARTVVVDGLAGLADTLAFPERGYRFVGRLLAVLASRGITSLFTLDAGAMTAAAGTPFAGGISAWFDNLFELSAGTRGDNARTLTIRKVRTTQLTGSVVLDIRLPP